MTLTTTEAPTAFDTHHDDVIHDAQVDFYGRRLATASSDRTIRIFQINENQSETLLSILSGHEGPVWQVAWAHPKFGPILASCSYDGSVIIWQEECQKTGSLSSVSDRQCSVWTKLKVHRAHDSSVNSISFAPHEFGLHLACASSDGKISVLSYDSSGSSEWSSQSFLAHNSGCNAVSWCPSARPSSILSEDYNNSEVDPIGPMRLASGGCDNSVKLWKYEELSEEASDKQWQLEKSLEGHSDWVRDVCWRPNLGQCQHTLVSCGQDNFVLLWKQGENGDWSKMFLKKDPFPDTLWRVSFSEYGHLLAVSCGDNTVSLWHENVDQGKWQMVGKVDESITEAVPISEPLAVSPPSSAPLPNISFNSAASEHQPLADSEQNFDHSEQPAEEYIYESSNYADGQAYQPQEFTTQDYYSNNAELVTNQEPFTSSDDQSRQYYEQSQKGVYDGSVAYNDSHYYENPVEDLQLQTDFDTNVVPNTSETGVEQAAGEAVDQYHTYPEASETTGYDQSGNYYSYDQNSYPYYDSNLATTEDSQQTYGSDQQQSYYTENPYNAQPDETQAFSNNYAFDQQESFNDGIPPSNNNADSVQSSQIEF